MNPLTTLEKQCVCLLALTFSGLSVSNALDYHLAVDQPIGTSWNNLASWKTNSNGTGSSPASMATHAFFTNNHTLRANQTAFGGASLTLNGGNISLKTDVAGQTATIGNLLSTGGTILQANAYTTNTLSVSSCILSPASVTVLQASSGRAYTLALGTLSGAGSFEAAGLGSIRFTCNSAEGYTGDLVVGTEATLFHFNNAFQCRGGLILEAQARVYLNASIRVHKLKIDGVYLSAGTYTQSQLSAAYGAQMFPGGTGSIVVASGFPGSQITDATSVNVFQNLVPTNDDFTKWQACGVKYIRVHYTWSSIETSPGVYNWASADSLMAKAELYGIKVIWLLAWGNNLHEDDDLDGIQTPVGRQRFAEFASAICARYTQPGVIWEIWNEQDTAVFWEASTAGNTTINARERAVQYLDLIKVAIPAMKAANPNCTVVSGGVVNIGWSVSKAWLERAISLGLHDYVDGIAVHLYGGFVASGATSLLNNEPERIVQQVADLRAVLTTYGAPLSYPLLSTEYGASRDEAAGTEEDKSLRAAEVNMRMFFLTQLTGLKLNTWYVWKNYDGNSDGFAWLKWDNALQQYVARSSYAACTTLKLQFAGYAFEKRVPGFQEDDYVLSFTNGTNRKLVAWSSASAHSVPVAINSSATTFATHSLLGTAGTLTASAGLLTVPMSSSPLYIDLGSATVKDGVFVEVETLNPSASSGDTHSTSTDAAYSNGAFAYYAANQEGDFVSYTIAVPQAGTYVVKARFKKFSSRGKFQLSIDGIAQGGVQDEYAASAASGEVNLGAKAFGSGGSKVFRFTVPVPGKHPNSNGYGLSFDYIQLQPQ